MIRRSPSMTCCQRFEDGAAQFGLFLMNLTDAFLGGMFVSFGVYLRVQLGSNTNDAHTAWLAYLALIVGICLLIIVIFSFTSMNLTSCKFGVVLSGYLALCVSITSFIMAITALVVRSDLFDYLEHNGDDLGMSGGDIDGIKTWYSWVVVGLFCTFILQFVRYKWSSFLYRNYAVRDARYQSLLALEEEEYEVKLNAGRAERSERYGNLKNHYKNKYGQRENSNEDSVF